MMNVQQSTLITDAVATIHDANLRISDVVMSGEDLNNIRRERRDLSLATLKAECMDDPVATKMALELSSKSKCSITIGMVEDAVSDSI